MTILSVINSFLSVNSLDGKIPYGIFIATVIVTLIVQLVLIAAAILLYAGVVKDKNILIKTALIMLIAFFLAMTVPLALVAVILFMSRIFLLYVIGLPLVALAIAYTVFFTLMLFRILGTLNYEDGKFVPSAFVLITNFVVAVIVILLIAAMAAYQLIAILIFQSDSVNVLNMCLSLISAALFSALLLLVSNALKNLTAPATGNKQTTNL